MIGTEQHTQRTMPLAFDLSEHGFTILMADSNATDRAAGYKN